MATIKELVPNYSDLIAQGVSEDELKVLAKQRLTQQKEMPKVQNPKDGSVREYLKTSDDVLPQITRGLANNFIRTTELVNGLTGLEVPQYNKLVQLGEELEQTKEKISSKNITPQRKQEKEILAKESKDAKGFVENLKAGGKQLLDVATHPSEWTIQGATEFASDPTNAVSFGVGGAVAKGVASPLLRAFIGGGAAAGENAIINSGIEYAVARGQGKSVEEAQQIAAQSGAAGALAGGVLGGAGGAMAKPKDANTPKPKINPNKPNRVADMDSAFVGLGEDVNTNEEMNFDVVHIDPDTNEVTIINPSLNSGRMKGKGWVEGDKSNAPVPYVDPKTAEIQNPPAVLGDNIQIVYDDKGTPIGALGHDGVFTKELPYNPTKELPYNGAMNMGADGWSEAIGQKIQAAVDAHHQRRIFEFVEAENKAVENDALIKNITNDMVAKGITDPVVLNEQINKSIKLSDAELEITHIINDGKELPPNLSGVNLLTKLQNTIQMAVEFPKTARHPDELFGKLVSEGASEELAKAAAAAYEQRDINFFYEWYGNKLRGKLDIDRQKMLDDALMKANDIKKQSNNSDDGTPPPSGVKVLKEPLEELMEDPYYKDIIENARNRSSKDTQYGQRLVQRRSGNENYQAGGLYEPNYDADFSLTKADVKAIESGKITPQIIEKIKADLEVMQNDPRWQVPDEENPFSDGYTINQNEFKKLYIDKEGDFVHWYKKDLDTDYKHALEEYQEGVSEGRIDPDKNVGYEEALKKHYDYLKEKFDKDVEYAQQQGWLEESKPMSMAEKHQMANKYKYGIDSERPIMNDAEAATIKTQARGIDEEGRPLDKQPVRAGDVFKTPSGAETTPFPKQKSEKYINQWNIDNAILEAQRRGDSFNETQFKAMDVKNLSQADFDSINMYMATNIEQPKVAPKMLKPLVDDTKKPTPLDKIEEDISYKEAYDAHRGTSFSPEKRAKQRIDGYVEMLRDDYADLGLHVKDDAAKQALLDSRFADYREKMKSLYKDLLAKESRTMSSMITGGSNFPVASNRKKMGYADNARQKFLDTREKILSRIKRELNPKEKNPESLEGYRAKLAEQIKHHENMKKANTIMRNKTLSQDAKIKQLIELGFKKEDLKEIQAEGFPSYALTNSNGRIKHTKARIAELERLEAREAEGKASKELYEGASIEEDIPNKRVKIYFDDKPDAKMREILKKRGFKWSPTTGAWQRILTSDAKRVAKEVMDTHYKAEFDKTTKKMLEC